MGLFMDCFEFDGAPPTREELEAHLRAQLGSGGGVDAYEVDGRQVKLYCMLEPVTQPYAIAFLLGRGGRRVRYGTGEPAPCVLPDYVSRPWREHSWWFRLKVHLGFHRGLLGTIRAR